MNAQFAANLTLALVLFGGAAHANPDNAYPADPTLTVLVRDQSGMSTAALQDVESQVRLLLSRVGLRLDWTFCPLFDDIPSPAICTAKSEPGRIWLYLLPRDPRSQKKHSNPLGMAKVGDGDASIFVSEIRELARDNGLPASSLMACAATHEIGHLLLGRDHSSSGIMRGAWGTTEIRAMDQRWLGFSAAQRQALRQAVPAPEQRLASPR